MNFNSTHVVSYPGSPKRSEKSDVVESGDIVKLLGIIDTFSESTQRMERINQLFSRSIKISNMLD